MRTYPVPAPSETFQLPPSHEGERKTYTLSAASGTVFQLPPSHEGERRSPATIRKMASISTPALA